MKAKKRPLQGRENPAQQNERARAEMRTFRIALGTYARRFAERPSVSFEGHCRSLAESFKSRHLRRT